MDYDAYGRPRHHRMADLKGDGAVDTFDLIILTNHWDSASYADLNRDGTVNVFDQTMLINEWGAALPEGQLSLTDNILGYGGYIYDAELEIYLSRHRWYDPVLGRWLQRDPAGYVDGMNLYLYASSSPFVFVDPLGLWRMSRIVSSVCDALGIDGRAQQLAVAAGVAGDVAVGMAVDKVVSHAEEHHNQMQSDPTGYAMDHLMPGPVAMARDIADRAFHIELNNAQGNIEDITFTGLTLSTARVATGMQDLAEGIAGANMAENRLMSTRERWISGGSGAVQGGTIAFGGGALSGGVRVMAGQTNQVLRGGTYSLRTPSGEVVYVGRTRDLARRQREHARDPRFQGLQLRPERRTQSYDVMRGHEQRLYDQYRPPLNRNRPISPRNPNRQRYLDSAD